MKTNQDILWDLIPRLKVKTFEVTTKKVQVKAVGDKLVTVEADRDLFGHLLIATNAMPCFIKIAA